MLVQYRLLRRAAADELNERLLRAYAARTQGSWTAWWQTCQAPDRSAAAQRAHQPRPQALAGRAHVEVVGEVARGRPRALRRVVDVDPVQASDVVGPRFVDLGQTLFRGSGVDVLRAAGVELTGAPA